jgi:ferredoxin-NADP reductase
VTAPPSSAAAPSRWTEAVVRRVDRLTLRVIGVVLDAPLPLHVAGQHVDVRLTAPDGYQAQRSYSIASAPETAGLELAIEHLPDGEVSTFFDDVAQPGDTIEIRGPIGGHFVWSEADGGPLLLIAGGSGIAPLMAMLRHRRIHAHATPALLLYSARTWDEIIFRDELVAAAADDPAFAFVAAITRAPPQRACDYDRRLDATLLRDALGRWGHAPRHVYVCGSNGFVEGVTSALVTEGVPAHVIRAERFGGTA